MPKINLTVEQENCGLRLDTYVAENCDLSRTNIQKLIKENKLLVNGKSSKSSYKTELADEICLEFVESETTTIVPTNIPLDIIYEDDDILVINKQKGLVVHPAPGNYDNTLVNALLYQTKSLSDINGYYRPGIVHRIDKNTSGLLVVAKNNYAHQFIAEQLKDKSCYRKYYAIVKGVIENNSGEIKAPIGRNPKDRQKMMVTDINSKEAITQFKVLKRFENYSFLDIKLLTGRTHQIRVHMAYIHHPVLNDERYGKADIDDKGQYLHAYYLSFIHPTSKERVAFQTEIPLYMQEFIKQRSNNEE